ncbi:MAG: S10 family peptidase, partial [Pyrinomonadaceae bacterium]
MQTHAPAAPTAEKFFLAASSLILCATLAALPTLARSQEAQRTGRRGGADAQQRPDAQQQQGAQQPGGQGAQPGARPSPTPSDPAMLDSPPVVTHHSASVGGRTLNYTTTTGVMPLRNAATGETEARIFYMAYTLDGVADKARRPLMFSFNGGPGSASVWLHMGALGPRRVEMKENGEMPAPPFRLVDNDETWLDMTDIVFIDPVGTGYSRAARPDLAQRYFSLQGDIQSVGEFIRLYLTKSERWTSPLFPVGESYGTTRASGLSGYLIEHGIAFNGIILISTIMNFQTARFARGNDLPYILFLPTYTAIAWYHHKLAPDLQKDLRRAVEESERFAAGEYTTLLAKGDKLSDAERRELVEKVARLTGLSREYVEQSDARIEIQHFDKELLRSERRTVGRLDGRFKGTDSSGVGETPDFDPSMAAIRPPYTATFNDYVRTELGFRSDLEYYILGGGVGRWDFGADNSYADTSVSLASAFEKNPYMHLFV